VTSSLFQRCNYLDDVFYLFSDPCFSDCGPDGLKKFTFKSIVFPFFSITVAKNHSLLSSLKHATTEFVKTINDYSGYLGSNSHTL
jgi:hypothetical protein